MKKASLAVAILAASTSAAWAQSSVTLYGIVDAAVRYTSNANAGTSTKTLTPGGMSQSRLGVNITEDMGGGLKALANLEHRLQSDTGAVSGNPDFWRQAWVGLQSSEFGQIRLGRQYNILFDLYTSTFASFRYSPYIEAYKPEIGMAMTARQDNMVKYLVQLGNVYGEVQVSAGEGQSGAAAAQPAKPSAVCCATATASSARAVPICRPRNRPARRSRPRCWARRSPVARCMCTPRGARTSLTTPSRC